MPDSLQNITIDPSIARELDQFHTEIEAREQESRPDIQPARMVRYDAKSSILSVDTTARKEPHHRTAIVMTAHKEPQMPVSPRSIGGATTSWVILGLIAVFMLVSLRYARNFKFISSLGNDLISHKRKNRIFDDTVRETSFLTFLNILCIVSVGVLLYGGIELTHPAMRSSQMWHAALGQVILLIGVYYVCQWILYFILGRIFGSRSDTDNWMRGFSAGQGILGLILFPLALLSLFYLHNLQFPVVVAAVFYVMMRIVFIIKGIRIFSPKSASWLPFFYYLCGVEIAPVALLIHLATMICISTATIPQQLF